MTRRRQIYADFSKKVPDLQPAAEAAAAALSRGPGVHAVRSRVKDPEHVVAKIITRSIAEGKTWASPADYFERLGDSIGVRALLIFDDQYPAVDEFIRTKLRWNGIAPDAFMHPDDPEYLIEMFQRMSCKVRYNPKGYRSMHYEVSVATQVAPFRVEAQVRTLFEEARSESDHAVRYPRNMKNLKIRRYVNHLSRLARRCDHLTSILSDVYAMERLSKLCMPTAIDEGRVVAQRYHHKQNEYNTMYPDGQGI